MKITWKIIILTVTFLLLNACSSSSKYPVPCPAPPIPAAEMGADAVWFTISNRTCTTINAVNIAERSCNDYGVDQLNGQNIPSGETLSIPVLPGVYDVWVEECTGDNVEFTKKDLRKSNSLDYSDPNVKDPSECDTSITVVNHSDKPICHMWIASPTSVSFGMAWLSDGDQIAPGESRVFVVYADTYDIKAESCDWEQLRVELEVPVSGHLTWEVPEK